MARRLSREERADKYRDFYKRAFTDIDIDKIFEEGGQTSITNFKQLSKQHIKDTGYWNAMFGREKESKILGKQIFSNFFEDDRITQNVNDRIIVRTGKTINFAGKIRKGGQFLPKAYFLRRK